MRHGRLRFLAGAMIPPLALYGLFVLWPYAQAFYLAFTDFDGVSADVDLVWFDNFTRLWDDRLFRAGLTHTALLVAVVPPATVALGLFLAAATTSLSPRRLARAYRVVYFFPQLLSVAIVAVLWQFVYTPNSGLLNGFLTAVGIDGRTWLAEPDLALWCVVAAIIWSAVGFYVVLFAAAIDSIPTHIVEAARIDGAGPVSLFLRITLPLVWDSVQVAFVYLGILALDGFALVQIMTVGPGGPDNSTEVIGLTLYRAAFTYGKFGYASAMGVVLFFLSLTLAVLAMRFSRREAVELA